MKKSLLLTIFLSIFALSTNSFADCKPAFEKEISRYLKMHKRTKIANAATTSGVFAITAGFWGTMGVIMVGPWGVLIGAQFGALAAAPVGTTFLMAQGWQKLKLKKLGETLQLINQAEGSLPITMKKSAFKKVYKKLQKKHRHLTKDLLKNEIMFLNESKALCDGTVSKDQWYAKLNKKLAMPWQIRKYLQKQL